MTFSRNYVQNLKKIYSMRGEKSGSSGVSYLKPSNIIHELLLENAVYL